MRERETPGQILGVREFSRDIVSKTGLLEIHEPAIATGLVPYLTSFRKDITGGPDQFADEKLSADDELGLNVFFNVVNYCFQSPVTGEEFAYVRPDATRVLRSSGLKAAMVDSGTGWGNFYHVAYMSGSDWASIWNPSINPNFYNGWVRGLAIKDSAKKFIKMGITTVHDLLSASSYSADKLITNLRASGHFEDPFLKRAQLAVHLINGPLMRRFDTKISGVENLTVMADYRLPQLLYNSGAIALSEDLKTKLVNKVKITSGSPEEIALRAATIVVGEKISAQMDIPEAEVDSLMWLAARKLDKEKRLQIPHMIVATEMY